MRTSSSTEAPARTPLDEQQVARRGRRILALLAIFSIINFGDKAVLGLAGPRIIDDLHLSNTEFGSIGSFFYLLFSLSALLVGPYGGRLPATWLLGAMALVWSAAQLPILVPAAGFATLIATRVLLGAGEGPGLPMANHVAFTWFPPARRTTAAGVITMGGALGVILGGPVLAATIARRGVALCIGTAISSLGAVISPSVTGSLLDLAPSEAAGFDDAFRLAAFMALLGGISLLFLNPERDRLVER